MTLEEAKALEPGSTPAFAAGCRCFPYDGEGDPDPFWPGWVVRHCPVHGPVSERETDGLTRFVPPPA